MHVCNSEQPIRLRTCASGNAIRSSSRTIFVIDCETAFLAFPFTVTDSLDNGSRASRNCCGCASRIIAPLFQRARILGFVRTDVEMHAKHGTEIFLLDFEKRKLGCHDNAGTNECLCDLYLVVFTPSA